MKRMALVTSLCVTLSGLADADIHAIHPQQPREPETQDEHRAVEDARLRGGIPAAARVFGKFVAVHPGSPDFVSGDVKDLTIRSEVIVLATAFNDVVALSPDLQQLTTEYQVRVDRVLKGPDGLDSAEMIDVSLPGGQMRFEDGSLAEIKAEDLEPMVANHQYLIFLTRDPSPTPPTVRDRVGARGRYRTTMGSQGLFEIVHDGRSLRLAPAGDEQTPVARELRGLPSLEAACSRIAAAISGPPPSSRGRPKG